jgi:hypothetical protein
MRLTLPLHPPRLAALTLCCALTGLTGCTTDQFYRIGQAWQRDQCQRIQDHQERARCLAGVRQSPDAYQREVEGLRRVGP